ncbi:tol-pal system protein YbgF [Salinihabitans flavidus]|uniref:Cell division coordinator CpoB n=1 Tax=Salinihabitans flavidus TaxID=569882 RepID=A0A1H8R4X3_9RHOB|nr:tetratricopeptide repeat protein [Salinihabitans flavidus]SEO61729.1 tol-pal system protein YbgF [Salinihabitans flavidus]
MRVFVQAVVLVVLAGLIPVTAPAQDRDQTLADIRQQLSVLYVEVQRLKRELSTTGAPEGLDSGGSVLERMDAIESEMQRLTGLTERLEYRVERIVRDGTNRISDLEFRLVELEGGDVSQLDETTTLGGEVNATIPEARIFENEEPVETELAVGEEADFRAATDALEAGEHGTAVERFEAFLATYPGSPMTARAHLGRGRALEELGEMTTAARAYLESYSGAPGGPEADEALFHLGATLGKLGQTNEACVTLGEVAVRHPESNMVGQAREEMAALGC